MSLVDDLVKGVVDGALKEILKKTTGRSTLTRRRRRKATGSTATLRQIEKLLKPAKRQTSRKRTVRTRAKTKRRAW
ncbi:MAG: hypothetical protein WAT70_04365 [Rhizobiaceae bacterium]